MSDRLLLAEISLANLRDSRGFQRESPEAMVRP